MSRKIDKWMRRWAKARLQHLSKRNLPEPAKGGKSLVTIEQLLNQAVNITLEYQVGSLALYDSSIEWVYGIDAFKYVAYLRGTAIPFGGPVRKPEKHTLIGRAENQVLSVE